MARELTLPGAERDRVKLKDDTADVTRVFTMRVLTRSVKKEIRAKGQEIQALEKKIADSEKDPTDKQEEALMRLTCDLISTLLDPGESDVQAGDMLYEAWVEDRVSDDQILGLLASLDQSDPT